MKNKNKPTKRKYYVIVTGVVGGKSIVQGIRYLSHMNLGLSLLDIRDGIMGKKDILVFGSSTEIKAKQTAKTLLKNNLISKVLL